MSAHETRAVVEQFWAAMNRNDFEAVGVWLHDEYVLEWPQSRERIRGRADFAAVNRHYPAAGPWRFTVRRLLADETSVVSEVLVTDGATHATVITFSVVRDGRIVHQTEYWPDPFEAAPWRARWVEMMT